MSFWNRLFPPAKRDRFSRLVSAELQASGVTDPIQYDAESFTLTMRDGPAPTVLFLDNMYRDYCNAPIRRRREIIQRYVRPFVGQTSAIPDSFEQVKPNLLPRVRDRAFWGINQLAFELQGLEPKPVGRKSFTEHLEIELVYDCPEHIVDIPSENLDHWRISFEEALAIGRENLWKRSNADFLKIQPGLYASPWHDTHDASRVFLHDLIWQLEVKGDHVAMIPQRNVLLVTGSQDESGLLKMAEIANLELQGTRPMTGIAVRLEGNRWKSYTPKLGDLAYRELHCLWIATVVRDYAQQKQLLDKLHEKQGKDIFVASFIAKQNDDTGEVRSFCMWRENVDSLLPVTDRVAFCSDALPDPSMESMPKWDQVLAIAGELTERTELYPERYRVRQFPSREQLRALGVLS